MRVQERLAPQQTKMTVFEGVVISLSQVERRIEILCFGSFFSRSEVVTYSILHGELNIYLIRAVWHGYKVEWLSPNSPHIHCWREQFEGWTAGTKSSDLCFHCCVFWCNLSARQDKS
jgi:hypothetical protein